MSDDEGEYWSCPLLKSKILDAICIEINYELEGLVATNDVEKLAVQLGLSREGIRNVCLACPNNPLPEPKDIPT